MASTRKLQGFLVLGITAFIPIVCGFWGNTEGEDMQYYS